MPEILSLALFERRNRVLVTRRKPERPPFVGTWMLPAVAVETDESAEEALERHALKDLGVEPGAMEFAETLYLEDKASGTRYVANVFKVNSYEGEMRFRAESDYDDARWLSADELSSVPVPPQLRDWLKAGRFAPAQPAPMPITSGETSPDNRTAWNTISRAYQDRFQISAESIEWGPRLSESDLQLLGDVAGKRVLVVGCGGGQDCIVLAKQGAQVVGVDLSDKQIEYGRRLAEREGVLVTLLQGNAEQLREIEDESQDLVISAHALNYVERADCAFTEVFRVLRPGSPFVFSVGHPLKACLEGGPPYGVQKSYWDTRQDWRWEFPEKKAIANLRSWDRPVSEWFTLLTSAGFRVEQLLEPRPDDQGESPWDGSYDRSLMQLIPTTLIMKAVKP